MKLAFFGEKNTDNREQILDNLLLKANKDITFNLEDHSIYARGVKFDSKSCQSFYHENATGEEAYCKVTIDKTNDNGYGILIYGRRQCYIMTSGTSFTTSTYNQFLEIGSDYNNQPQTRCLNIKPVVNEKSSTITLYVTMGSYSYMQIVCAADVKFESSNTNFTNITGFIQCKSVNTGSNNLVTQTPIQNSNIAYRLLLSKNGTDNEETDVVNKFKNLLFNPSTETLISSNFEGYLDGDYINKLTNYAIATTSSDIVETDTLNTALGKLEYKINNVVTTYQEMYDWYISITTTDDVGDVIDKWQEIVSFIAGVKDNENILNSFVTITTDQTITGTKTFTSDITLYSQKGSSPSPKLIFQRAELNQTSYVDWSIYVDTGNLLFQESQGQGWNTVFQINYSDNSTITYGNSIAAGFVVDGKNDNYKILAGGGVQEITQHSMATGSENKLLYSDGIYASYSELKYIQFTFNKDGQSSYLLIGDLTDWNNTTNYECSLIGTMYGQRGGNQHGQDVYNITICITSWKGGTAYKLYTNVYNSINILQPCIVKYNGKTYLALKRNKSSKYLQHFVGYAKNILTQFTEVTSVNETLYSSGSSNSINTTTLFNGESEYEILHLGNYTSTLDKRYLLLTGGTLTGDLFMSGGNIIPQTDVSNLGNSDCYWNNVYSDKFIKKNSSNEYLLLGDGDHIPISNLIAAEHVYELENLEITETWMDTGIIYDQNYFPEGNGTYCVYMYCRSTENGIFNSIYSGIMSVLIYSGNDNSQQSTEEIILHGVHHDCGRRLYLRTFVPKGNLPIQLQIAASSTFIKAANITIKIKKLL